MKFLLFIPLFLSIVKPINLYAQKDKFLSVSYIKEHDQLLDTSKVKAYKKMIGKMNELVINYSKHISYELLIHNDQSIFYTKPLNLDASNQLGPLKELASSIGGVGGKFYVNKKDSVFLHEEHFLNEIFLLKMELKKWKVTDEFKLINNYRCYKAITEDTVFTLDGSQKSKVIAWFSPELPSFFGPANYYGLPGLILELKKDNMKLRAIKIQFSKAQKKRIKPLNKGIRITKEKLRELAKQRAMEMFPSAFKKKH